MNENTILQVKNLTHKFDDKIALNNVNFDVFTGEFLAILGPSGCGKTTILRTLIGLLEPTEGSILMDGNDITHTDPSKRNMGIVFQNYALFENMTVLQNVQYAMKFNKATKADSKQLALDMLERMGLSEHKNKKPNMLSGGQQQRVSIGRALMNNPSVILAFNANSGHAYAEVEISSMDIDDVRTAITEYYPDIADCIASCFLFRHHQRR